MRLEPDCPHCPAPLTTLDRTAWECPTHGPVQPLWRSVEPTYEDFAEYLLLARPLPTWLPWPMPAGWQITDFGCVRDDAERPRAAYVTCTGPSELDGVVDLTVLTEEPGVGVGARCAGVTHTDPGREAGEGAAPTRIRVDGAGTPVWPVSTSDTRSATPLDRAVLVGEAQGRWLWLVLRPASAVLLLPRMGALHDISELGPELVALPFGTVPRAW